MAKSVKQTAVLRSALTAICEIMRSSGISRSEALVQLRDACANGYKTGLDKESRKPRPITQMADLCSRWHLERRYVDRQGKPKALSWDGRKGSLLRLAEHVHGRPNARQVVAELVRRKLVKRNRDGKWIPKGLIVSPAGFDDAQALRTATMTSRLLRTVIHNSASRYRGPKLLLEVMAQVPKLPSRDLPDFRRLAKAQGLIFARTMDLWLESRNIQRRSDNATSTREAGVVAFAFAD